MRDDVKAFVRNMRICCGDVQLGDEDECAVFCANPRDVRDGEARFCRQWLVKDAADLIESLAAELEQVKQERDGLSIMLTSATSAAETYKHERDELDAKCRQLQARNDTLIAKEVLFDEAIAAGAKMQREQDAAVEDLAIHKFCHLCAEDPIAEEASKCPSCVNKCYWQWRGVKED